MTACADSVSIDDDSLARGFCSSEGGVPLADVARFDDSHCSSLLLRVDYGERGVER